MTSSSPSPTIPTNLSQRHSPIGAEQSEEDDPILEDDEVVVGDDDNWEDWGENLTNDNEGIKKETVNIKKEVQKTDPKIIEEKIKETRMSRKGVVDLDMDTLDIKVSKTKPEAEIDFFADMEPVIKSKMKSESKTEPEKPLSKFDVVVEEEAQGDGWGDDEEEESGWGDV